MAATYTLLCLSSFLSNWQGGKYVLAVQLLRRPTRLWSSKSLSWLCGPGFYCKGSNSQTLQIS